MQGKPECEIEFSDNLLRDLLASQHPDLAGLPVAYVGSGWDNEIYRLGCDLALRMPRRAAAAQLVLNEQRWLPELACVLPISVPAPLRAGVPNEQYPWHWSIVPWFDGTEADLEAVGSDSVTVLVDFLKVLHAHESGDAPFNPYRSVPVSGREELFMERAERLKSSTGLITPKLMRLWEQGLNAPVAAKECWLHADLHAQNVLVKQSSIHAIIDWGDMARGDPATDLVSIWSLFSKSSDRERALSEYGPDEAMLLRARAWAAMIALILIDSGMHSSPRHERQGRKTLKRILADV